jgi:hypothetical protein
MSMSHLFGVKNSSQRKKVFFASPDEEAPKHDGLFNIDPERAEYYEEGEEELANACSSGRNTNSWKDSALVPGAMCATFLAGIAVLTVNRHPGKSFLKGMFQSRVTAQIGFVSLLLVGMGSGVLTTPEWKKAELAAKFKQNELK